MDDLASILPSKENFRIRVRIVRIWKVHAFLNPSESSSIEMVLVDEKQNPAPIQTRVPFDSLVGKKMLFVVDLSTKQAVVSDSTYRVKRVCLDPVMIESFCVGELVHYVSQETSNVVDLDSGGSSDDSDGGDDLTPNIMVYLFQFVFDKDVRKLAVETCPLLLSMINSPEDVYFENLNEDQTGLNTPCESKVVAHDDHDAGFSPKKFEENMTKMRLGVLFPTTHASNVLKEIPGMGSQHILRNLYIAEGNPLSRGSSNLMPMVMDL
ncbi:hypothetical protein QL285_088715 [Trifolium repens]|nr:hypothetical protein QL285_088715 [Trifolium repens]